MRNCLALSFCLLLLCGCQSDKNSVDQLLAEQPLSVQPVVKVIESDTLRVRVTVDFNDLPSQSITEYGIIWFSKQEKELNQNCVYSRKGEPGKRETFELPACFPENSIYFRSFIRTSDEVIYGAFCNYIHPLKPANPTITAVSPNNLRIGSKIELSGTNFIITKNLGYQQFFINDLPLPIDSVTETKAWATIPNEFATPKHWNEEVRFSVRHSRRNYPGESTVRLLTPWRELGMPSYLNNGTLKNGSAAVKGNKAYIFFAGETQMLTYQIYGSSFERIYFPGKISDFNSVNHTNINTYCFNHKNQIYVANDTVIYKLDGEARFSKIARFPDLILRNYVKSSPMFYCYADNMLYAGSFIGKYPYTKERFFCRYLIDEDRWETLPPLPNSVFAAEQPNFIFFDGGDHLALAGTGFVSSCIYKYSKSEKTWREDSDASFYDMKSETSSATLQAFVIGGTPYAALGESREWPLYCSRNAIKRNSDGTWERVPPCPVSQIGRVTFVFENKAFFFGTDKENNKYFYEFDPSYL